MKKRFLHPFIFLCLGIIAPIILNGQTPYVKQIITANSGKFEYIPPFQDFVTLQSYNPVNGAVNLINTVFTQSSQDICLHGSIAYFAAQDSIIKINLNTNQRIAAVADSGLGKLFLFGNKLVVSKQYPITTFFAEVLDTADLSLVTSIAGIPGDCGNMVAAGDSIYLAVNGGWNGTEGKIAVIETSGWTLAREINLGAEAIGTFGVYRYNNLIFTINKSPYTTPDVGSITIYNLDNHTFRNTIINKNVGLGAGIDGHLLYFGLNYGIGSFNMNTMQVEDTVVIADPGSALFKYITSATVDTLNKRLYVNIGDYATTGTCLIYTLSGDSVTSYATGISSDAIAVDYRLAPVGIANLEQEPMSIKVYPNPVSDKLFLSLREKADIQSIQISDISGRILIRQNSEFNDKISSVSCRDLPRGMYYLIVETSGGKIVRPFVKQ
ncbi:MAG: T9SS type A sorting domain-containing protein [Bacteroidales bacterium]|nr:T9SS type A sorting domain-containing protein [Bacteroidales bacterium]